MVKMDEGYVCVNEWCTRSVPEEDIECVRCEKVRYDAMCEMRKGLKEWMYEQGSEE